MPDIPRLERYAISTAGRGLLLERAMLALANKTHYDVLSVPGVGMRPSAILPVTMLLAIFSLSLAIL